MAAALSLASPDPIITPLSSSFDESDLKEQQELQSKLNTLFGLKYVRKLTDEEIARRNAILKTPQQLFPNPAIDISTLGISAENLSAYLPVLSFSVEEILHFLIPKLKKHRVTKNPPFFSGGFARHCLAETSFKDLDINVFIEADGFELILQLFRNFLEIKLRALDVKLDASPEIFEFIEAAYLYKKKTLKEEGNPHRLASLISLGGIEFKFILVRHYRYYVADYERFLVPVFDNSLFFAHPEASYTEDKSSQAIQNLILGKFYVENPRNVIDLPFRMVHAITNGFSIISSADLLLDSLDTFKTAYPLDKPALLMQKFQNHQDSHYPNDPQAQLIDFLNFMGLLQNISDLVLRHHYIAIVATAFSTARTPGELKLSKEKTLKSYTSLFLPIPASAAAGAGAGTGAVTHSSRHSEPIKAFRLLSSLIEQHPEISSSLILLIQTLFCFEWCKKNPNISFESISQNWQLALTHAKGISYLNMPEQTIEEMAIHTLRSWRELSKFQKIIEEVVRELHFASFSFGESHKRIFTLELLKVIDSSRMRSLTSLRAIREFNPEFIRKELAECLEPDILNQWYLKTSLRRLSKASSSTRETPFSLLIAFLYHRIRTTDWQFTIEHFKQLNRHLQILRPLNDPKVQLLLADCFLLLLSKIRAPILNDFFLEIYQFGSSLKHLGILREEDSLKVSALIAQLHEESRLTKEVVLMRGIIDALMEDCARQSQIKFRQYTEILCSFESIQKMMPTAAKIFAAFTPDDFERNRSKIMHIFICQIMTINWHIAEEALYVCQEKMITVDFIQALYLIMKEQISCQEPAAFNKALSTWFNNCPNKINFMEHFLIGIKLLETSLTAKLETEVDSSQKVPKIVDRLIYCIKESHAFFEHFPGVAAVKMKAELLKVSPILSRKFLPLTKKIQQIIKQNLTETFVSPLSDSQSSKGLKVTCMPPVSFSSNSSTSSSSGSASSSSCSISPSSGPERTTRLVCGKKRFKEVTKEVTYDDFFEIFSAAKKKTIPIEKELTTRNKVISCCKSILKGIAQGMGLVASKIGIKMLHLNFHRIKPTREDFNLFVIGMFIAFGGFLLVDSKNAKRYWRFINISVITSLLAHELLHLSGNSRQDLDINQYASLYADALALVAGHISPYFYGHHEMDIASVAAAASTLKLLK